MKTLRYKNNIGCKGATCKVKQLTKYKYTSTTASYWMLLYLQFTLGKSLAREGACTFCECKQPGINQMS